MRQGAGPSLPGAPQIRSPGGELRGPPSLLNAAISRGPRLGAAAGPGLPALHSTLGALIYFGITFNCFLLVEALTCDACKSDPNPPYGALVFHFQMHSPWNNDCGITQFEFCCWGLYYIMLSN